MKILTVSDNVLRKLEHRENLERNYGSVNVVISCGDLPHGYLEYITGVLNVPLFYVRGNHDIYYSAEHPGGENLHRRVVRFNGYLFAGLEGCIRYNRDPIQYTDYEMLGLVLEMYPRVLFARARNRRRLDVMVTHAPLHRIHDLPDKAHHGFKAFRLMARLFKPRYLIHGHVDTHDPKVVTRTRFYGTEILNINPSKVLDLTDNSGGT